MNNVELAVYGVWGWCVFEMVGLLDTGIHDYLGRAMILCTPIYLKFFRTKQGSDVKKQMFDKMLSVMSDEIRKLGSDEDKKIIETDFYIHDQISKLQEEISENIDRLQKRQECSECYPGNCMLCGGDFETILDCVDGMCHWWQCNVCGKDVHRSSKKEDPDPDPLGGLGHAAFSRHGQVLRNRGRSRTKRYVRTDRSRSRDRESSEEEYESLPLGNNNFQRNCDHTFITHVIGMYDKCKKCTKCDYEMY